MAIGSCLVDTNILLRMARRSDPQHELVGAALAPTRYSSLSGLQLIGRMSPCNFARLPRHSLCNSNAIPTRLLDRKSNRKDNSSVHVGKTIVVFMGTVAMRPAVRKTRSFSLDPEV